MILLAVCRARVVSKYTFRAHLDSSVGTVSLQVTGETSLAAAEEFLGRLLWETETHYPGTTVLR